MNEFNVNQLFQLLSHFCQLYLCDIQYEGRVSGSTINSNLIHDQSWSLVEVVLEVLKVSHLCIILTHEQ